jgi:threonine/homoserine/homoserine lactone efflux protein
MSRLIIPLAIFVAAALFGGAYFWATHPPAYAVSVAQVIDHHFVVAAFTVTWTVQLSYLTWLGLKWRSQKRDEERADYPSR